MTLLPIPKDVMLTGKPCREILANFVFENLKSVTAHCPGDQRLQRGRGVPTGGGPEGLRVRPAPGHGRARLRGVHVPQGRPGRQFNRDNFGLKNGLSFHFYSGTSKLPIFELFLSVGNLEPKLKRFFKPKLKPKCVLLNCHPGLRGSSMLLQKVKVRAQAHAEVHLERGVAERPHVQ